MIARPRDLELAGGGPFRTVTLGIGPTWVRRTPRAIEGEGCRRGHKVRFFTVSGLVNTYIEAREERQVLRLEKQICRNDLIVIDELGHIPLDRSGAEHLFGFFIRCHEQTSLIVTTNLPFAEWPRIFAGDERLAGALLDCVTGASRVV